MTSALRPRITNAAARPNATAARFPRCISLWTSFFAISTSTLTSSRASSNASRTSWVVGTSSNAVGPEGSLWSLIVRLHLEQAVSVPSMDGLHRGSPSELEHTSVPALPDRVDHRSAAISGRRLDRPVLVEAVLHPREV